MKAETTERIGADIELAVLRIRLRLALRLAWLRHLSDLGLGDAEIATGDRDRLDDELAWREATAPPELLAALIEAESSLHSGGGRVGLLADMFNLDGAELDLVHVCLAAAVDERIGRRFGELHHDGSRRHVTELAAARLCDRDSVVLATAESPLRTWGLVVETVSAPGEAPAVELDRTIVAWLHGVTELDRRLVGVVQARAAHEPLESWPVAEVAERCRTRPGADQPDPVRIVVRGRPGSGRRSFATAVAAALGLPAIGVDADRIRPGTDEPMAVQRHAFLERCVPVWHGSAVGELRWPTTAFPVQFACVDPGAHLDELPDVTDVVVELGPLSLEDRVRLWDRYLPANRAWVEPARSDVVERPHVTPADIAHVAGRRPASAQEAAEFLRGRNRQRLGPLVTAMPLPYGRADLVVNDRVRDALEFLVDECRCRRRFWSGCGRARLFPQAGLVALFAGPPGVGKTMASQVVAAELGVDLLRVNLAETISKYVGDTAKHLQQVLQEASDLDAVLLVDEADTLFGKRTEIRDAHDRWANADTNFLLQAIETYPGVAVLATNRRDQLDDAFTRRLRHVIEFARPDAAARLALWRSLLADVGADVAADDGLAALVARLAGELDLTGAEIKHAVLNAALVAVRADETLGPEAVLAGLDRELAKQGRALSSLERRRILGG